MALGVATFVIDKLKDPVLQEASLLYGISGKVDSVTRQLEYIKVALEAAEERGKENKAAKLWMDQVREVAFRIEDAIDIYHIELQRDVTTATHGGCRLFSNFGKWIQKNHMKLVARHNLGVELSDIEDTLRRIKENKEMFNFDGSGPGESSYLKEKLARHKSQLEYLDETQIVGLEDDKQAIVKKLLDAKVRNVISIVGTGGLGKTTLARKVFNSTEVSKNFNLRIWLSVSREFSKVNILKKMLRKIRKAKQEEVKQEDKDQDDEDYFIDEIRNSLKKQRFLIVLDDVWDQTFWPDIRHIWPPDDGTGQERGQLLITTRDLDVADKARSETHSPPFLNPTDSKKLLYICAFPEQEVPGGLDDVATEIANKCAGLPLALIVVGGQLYKKDKHIEWRKVADSMNWHEGKGIECIKVLETSYDDMPIILRTCFMYLASFPEDYKIDAKSLIRTWVAENIVSDEETADDCLQQLAQRCLIIVRKRSYDGSVEEFCIHDIVLEMAIKKAKENKYLWVLVRNEKKNPNVVDLNDARRASLQSSPESSLQSNNRKYNKKLRSFLVFGDKSDLPDDFDLLGFRLLTVLKMHHCGLISYHKLEKWCQELIYLRHLELRDCFIENKKIPESIGQLKNLLTLDFTGTGIDEVPDTVWSITTLRHLVSSSGSSIAYIHAPKLATIPNLESLWSVKLEPSKYHFPQLRYLRLYSDGPWVANDLLKNVNKNLHHLEIFADHRNSYCLDDVVLDMRDFPFYQNLQCLWLYGYWPKHVGLQAHLFPPHLTRLVLEYYTFVEDPMPELEQLQNLEILELYYPFSSTGEKMITRLTCSNGGFPQLQKLELWGFETVEEFSITPGAMPMLKELTIQSFRTMRNNIPELQHLKMLRRFEWRYAPFNGEKEIQAMRKQNQHKLQHIPTVVIY